MATALLAVYEALNVSFISLLFNLGGIQCIMGILDGGAQGLKIYLRGDRAFPVLPFDL